MPGIARQIRRFCWIVLLVLLGSPVARAQSHTSGESNDLTKVDIEDLLSTTVVSAARHPQRIIDSPRSVSVITGEELRQRNYRTVPEALAELVGVSLQETNYGGGSPIIRGMIGNRILILVDGIRLNNSAYRLGPNQYLNTIDIFQVERIEVTRGTRSVLYGSDAIGGVINVITRSPEPSPKGEVVDARFESRAATADQSAVGRVLVNYYKNGFGLLGGLTAKSFGDLRSGLAAEGQPHTGYREKDGDLKLSYDLSPRQGLTAGFQKVWQDDVPRTDVLTTGMKGELPAELKNEWRPEERNLLYAEFHHNAVGSLIDRLQLTVSHQSQKEEQERVKTSTPDVQMAEYNDVRTEAACLQMNSSAGEHHYLTYGAEYYQDQVRSLRTDTNLATGYKTDNVGRIANGARYWSGAFFLQDEAHLLDPLTLNLGIRLSQFSLQAHLQHAATGELPLSAHPRALTGNAYGSIRLKENLFLMGGVGQGFRAPSVDDMTIVSSFAGGFEVPNTNLKPEQALTMELGLKRQGRRFSGTVFGFQADYRDLIDRAAGLFQGLSFLDANHDGVRQPSEEAVYQRMNTGRARIRGLEMEGQERLNSHLQLYGNIAWFRGDDIKTGTPMTRIPQRKGVLGTRWTPKADRWLEVYSVFAGRQDHLSAADMSDRRIAPNGTPGFVVLNLRGGMAFTQIFTVSLGVENLTDKAYRWHGSGINAPGRNLVFGLKADIL